MKFNCTGHENILATHKSTIEFTKDNFLTKNGDCIIGINANFSYGELMKFVKNNKKAKLIIEIEGLVEEIIGEINKEFNHKNEIVLRLGSFMSDRTLMINCNKAAKHINREIIKKLKQRKNMNVIICENT
ncbi:hypothetical protein COV11_01495 [Candidatus Woesearchaeota archaeon CG10_big_fil_rev_8_21_14_0_10_30_7]|nr:MAG: hypothetical protein COV11_01495 [Candidatus Woesearchaeota archaeon CG10_big_fil_rev_8_21_14_0_10_30_7]